MRGRGSEELVHGSTGRRTEEKNVDWVGSTTRRTKEVYREIEKKYSRQVHERSHLHFGILAHVGDGGDGYAKVACWAPEIWTATESG